MVNNTSVLRLLRLAYKIVRRFAVSRGVPRSERDDLDQSAALALVLARNRFRPGRGSRFRSFAAQWVRGEVAHWWGKRVEEVVVEYRSDSLDRMESPSTQREAPDLSWVWRRLKPNAALVLRHTFGIDAERLSDIEIGRKLGITRQAVHRTRQRAVRKLKRIGESI